MDKPKILHVQVSPGLEPDFYESMLGLGLDAIIIGAYATGTVPTEKEYSFIPFIRKATELKIPVYLLRGSLSAARKPEWEQHSYRRSLEHIYGPERDAIRAGKRPPEIEAIKSGGTPLERPDASQTIEVIETIRNIYAKRPGYHEGIEEVSKLFSSPEFMEQVRKIRN